MKRVHNLIFKRVFFKKSVNILHDYLKKFVKNNIKGMIYYPAYRVLKRAQKDKQLTVIISSSADFLVPYLAKNFFKVDFCYATRYQKNMHGELLSLEYLMDGSNKSTCIKSLAKSLGIDKKDILAFTDSAEDLPLLHAVGLPFAVNPCRRLRKIAQKNDWGIL